MWHPNLPRVLHIGIKASDGLVLYILASAGLVPCIIEVIWELRAFCECIRNLVKLRENRQPSQPDMNNISCLFLYSEAYSIPHRPPRGNRRPLLLLFVAARAYPEHHCNGDLSTKSRYPRITTKIPKLIYSIRRIFPTS